MQKDKKKGVIAEDLTDIRRQIIAVVIGGVLTALVTNFLFILNINNTIDIIREDQKALKEDLDRLQDHVFYGE